ncbi:PREDICTED: uncharacterized protein LOC105559258 [Vollenhovia emeryi]|uniref:uncharacterized protein LOC105559258 n=1 Tax=Vollenhovia emeryi TaxID=411798 RepID=UPI0005F40BAB|nr:PREDICTED: uncharacterized protein LOC105559258 [Vollenhovia emeryi]
MYRVSLLLLILTIQADGFWVNKEMCHRTYKQKYPEDKNNYNTTVGFFNSSFIQYCPSEEVPLDDDIIYGIHLNDYAPELPDFLQILFPPPKRECMYGITLLINPSIQDAKECSNTSFDPYDDWRIHSTEINVCVFKYENPSVEIGAKGTYLYEDSIDVWFRYAYTGCYAVRFTVNSKQKYVVSNPRYLVTSYPRTEVTVPQLVCRYNARPNPGERKMTNFTLDISMHADTYPSFLVSLISQLNKDLTKGCLWEGEPLLFTWKIDLDVHRHKTELTDKHCVVKFVKTEKGKYKKNIRCNFQLEAEATSSCFLYNVIDNRCTFGTVWNPPTQSKYTPCMWVMHCEQTFESWRHVETVKPEVHPDTLLSASSYLLLPVIATVLLVSAVIGILCFRRHLRIRKEEINLYVNPQHDDSNCLKPTDIIEYDNEKEIGHGNPPCNNIVLLYTNSSTSFMALMKYFRKTLVKLCSCPVHDWHDGAVWNEVAKVGAVSWFTELLNSGCRIIWIDTPVTRSAIMSNSGDVESSSDKLSKYYEIHDFRDIAFRGVLEVAKSKVNDVARQYRRHFVVRFEGSESTANVDDPFLDLSPHARYYMPQHLMQLCTDLSVLKSEISKCKTKVDEDVYHIFVHQLYKSQTQQRLKSIKMVSST